ICRLYFYDAQSNKVYQSEDFSKSQHPHLPKFATSGVIEQMTFLDNQSQKSLYIAINNGNYVSFTFDLKECDPPREFQKSIEEYRQAYRYHKRIFYENIPTKELYKQILKLEAKVAELTQSS
ncbi:MAG: hypothetical protein H0U27_09870, partial [Nitrosopumilus sp.]|nr:hypothetical protein [Nitrosopumilus sp.]